jgi:hypothetical protein
MNDRELIKQIDFKDETGSRFELKYFLDNREHAPEQAILTERRLFSIAVEKHAPGECAEAEDTGWFSADWNEAMALMDLLVKNTVTPTTLHYIADDVLC